MRQQRHALFSHRRRALVRQKPRFPPGDLQRVAQQDLHAVPVLFRAGHIHPHQGRKADPAAKLKAVLRAGLPCTQKRRSPLRRAFQRLQQQLLAALSASFELELQLRLLAQLVLEPQQDPGELLLLEGLEQVILHPVFESVLGIFKFPVTADDDKVQLGLERLGPLDQLNAVAAGHTHVRDEQVGLLFPHQLQGMQPVVGGADDLIAQLFPVNELLHKQNDLVLVICQNDPQHKHFLRHYPKRKGKTTRPFSLSFIIMPSFSFAKRDSAPSPMADYS